MNNLIKMDDVIREDKLREFVKTFIVPYADNTVVTADDNFIMEMLDSYIGKMRESLVKYFKNPYRDPFLKTESYLEFGCRVAEFFAEAIGMGINIPEDTLKEAYDWILDRYLPCIPLKQYRLMKSVRIAFTAFHFRKKYILTSSDDITLSGDYRFGCRVDKQLYRTYMGIYDPVRFTGYGISCRHTEIIWQQFEKDYKIKGRYGQLQIDKDSVDDSAYVKTVHSAKSLLSNPCLTILPRQFYRVNGKAGTGMREFLVRLFVSYYKQYIKRKDTKRGKFIYILVSEYESDVYDIGKRIYELLGDFMSDRNVNRYPITVSIINQRRIDSGKFFKDVLPIVSGASPSIIVFENYYLNIVEKWMDELMSYKRFCDTRLYHVSDVAIPDVACPIVVGTQLPASSELKPGDPTKNSTDINSYEYVWDGKFNEL